jgi:D-glycero-D-manno-heptose 1,7-bisphosphate phosphatase
MSRPCVFLDRDGVINQNIQDDYVRAWSQFRFLPNIVDWIRLFNALDHLVVVVTNQRGVALGRMTMADVDAIHSNMLAELRAQGAQIDDIFVCPHGLDSCDCRKPQPGLVLQAQKKHGIDLSKSLLIGDSDSDEQLARNCGLRFLRAAGGRLTAGSL